MGTLHGYWDIASPFAGAENKGGYIYDGKTDGKTYELKGKETHDGICQAKVPKDIIISGNCGTGHQHKSTLRDHSWFESYLYWYRKVFRAYN
jgi:hypothetical protein